MKKIIKIVLWVCVLAVMGVIFSLSAEDAKVSTDTSDRVIEKILDFTDPGFRAKTEVEREARIDEIDASVRQLAHLAIFCLLGITTCAAVSFLTEVPIIRFGVSIILSAAYAIFDEIHQIFVPGRSFELEDVAVDFLGSLIGVLIVLSAVFLYNSAKERKRKAR